MMLEGVLGIAEGLNPKLIRTKLEVYSLPAGQGQRSGGKNAEAKMTGRQAAMGRESRGAEA